MIIYTPFLIRVCIQFQSSNFLNSINQSPITITELRKIRKRLDFAKIKTIRNSECFQNQFVRFVFLDYLGITMVILTLARLQFNRTTERLFTLHDVLVRNKTFNYVINKLPWLRHMSDPNELFQFKYKPLVNKSCITKELQKNFLITLTISIYTLLFVLWFFICF